MKQEKIDNAKGVAESEKQRQARLKELDEIKKEVMRLKKLGLMPPVEEKKPVPLLVPPRGLNR